MLLKYKDSKDRDHTCVKGKERRKRGIETKTERGGVKQVTVNADLEYSLLH